MRLESITNIMIFSLSTRLIAFFSMQVLATQAEQVDSKANNLDNLSSLGKLLSKNFGQIQPNKNLKVI